MSCMPLRPLPACQVDGALADETMSQASVGTNDGHMGPPLNNWRTIYDYQDTGMVPRTVASLRSKSLVWTYAMLTRLGFPRITMRDKGKLDSDAKACHAVYHDGRCRTHCGDPCCTLRIKSTVFLPGHFQRKPGYAIIKVFGAHPAGVTSGPPDVLVSGDAPTSQASRPTRLSNLPSDLTHKFFDTHRRLGFANVTHALCHTSTAVQSLLLCEGFVNILRDMPSRCQQQMCLPCRLAEIDEFSAAPPSDANQRVVYSLLEPLGSWLLSRQLSPYGHNDASEVLGHLLSSIRAISVQPPDARHTVCTEAAVKLTRLLLNQVQQTVTVEQLCDCGIPPEVPIAVGQTPLSSTVGSFLLEVDISSGSDAGAPSLQSLSDASFAPGVQNKGVLNFVRCSGCYNPTTNSVALREQSTLMQVAPLLVIGLQRSSFDRSTMEPKMNTMPVEMSRELKIHGYLYSLTSFAVLVTGPHWILYKRGPEDTWWLYDDSVVKGPLPFPSTARLATRFLTYERVTAMAEERGDIKVSASPDQDATKSDAATQRRMRIGTKTRFVAGNCPSDQVASNALGDSEVVAALPRGEVLPAAQTMPAEEAMLEDRKCWEAYLQGCDEMPSSEASMSEARLASDANQERLPDLFEAAAGVSAGRSSELMEAAAGVAPRRSSETDDAPSVDYNPPSVDYDPARLKTASQCSKLLGEDACFVPPSVDYNPAGLEMASLSDKLLGEATGFADRRSFETDDEEMPELDDRCDTATPLARVFSVTSSEQAGCLRSSAVPPPAVLNDNMVTSSTSTIPAVMSTSVMNAAPADLLSCMPLRPLHRSFEPAAPLGNNQTPILADALHASEIAAPADSSTRSRDGAVPPISRRNEAQSEFARRFGALEPQYNPNFDAPPQLAATFEPVSLGLMPPNNVDFDDMDAFVNEYSSSGHDEHGYMDAQHDTHRQFDEHVRQLLSAYHVRGPLDPRTGVPIAVMRVLRDLPLMGAEMQSTTYPEMFSRMRAGLSSLLLNRHLSCTACQATASLSDTMIYPLAVLCGAASVSAKQPVLFMADFLLAFANSLHHKDLGIRSSRWQKTSSRLWVAASAVPGMGKSPATKPLIEALTRACNANPTLSTGEAPYYHRFSAGGTHIGALTKLMSNDGYMLYVNDEAHNILSDKAAASGGRGDGSKGVDITASFMNASSGDEVEWETAMNLNKQDAQKKKKAKAGGDLTKPPVTSTPLMTRQSTTNVVFNLCFHMSCFRDYWARIEGSKIKGLGPRFLFVFGDAPPPKQSEDDGFVEAVFIPFITCVFRQYLQHLGPKSAGDQRHVENPWRYLPGQQTAYNILERLVNEWRVKIPHCGYLAQSCEKIGFWTNAYALEMGILSQITKRILHGDEEVQRKAMTRVVPMRCFMLACNFFIFRFLNSHATLMKEILRTPWDDKNVTDASELQALHYMGRSEEEIMFTILRRVPYVVITITDVARFLPVLFEQALNSRSSKWEMTCRSILSIFRVGVEWGLGCLVATGTDAFPAFHRRHWTCLPASVRKKIVEERVEAKLFGALRSPLQTLTPHELLTRFEPLVARRPQEEPPPNEEEMELLVQKSRRLFSFSIQTPAHLSASGPMQGVFPQSTIDTLNDLTLPEGVAARRQQISEPAAGSASCRRATAVLQQSVPVDEAGRRTSLRPLRGGLEPPSLGHDVQSPSRQASGLASSDVQDVDDDARSTVPAASSASCGRATAVGQKAELVVGAVRRTSLRPRRDMLKPSELAHVVQPPSILAALVATSVVGDVVDDGRSAVPSHFARLETTSETAPPRQDRDHQLVISGTAREVPALTAVRREDGTQSEDMPAHLSMVTAELLDNWLLQLMRRGGGMQFPTARSIPKMIVEADGSKHIRRVCRHSKHCRRIWAASASAALQSPQTSIFKMNFPNCCFVGDDIETPCLTAGEDLPTRSSKHFRGVQEGGRPDAIEQRSPAEDEVRLAVRRTLLRVRDDEASGSTEAPKHKRTRTVTPASMPTIPKGDRSVSNVEIVVGEGPTRVQLDTWLKSTHDGERRYASSQERSGC